MLRTGMLNTTGLTRLLAPARIGGIVSYVDLPNVIVVEHPFIRTKLTELRDFTADHRKFRALLDEIAGSESRHARCV
jgi:hypothetical protein